MAEFKPAYLIHGDEHGRITERRNKLRQLAEAESGVEGVQVFEGDQCTPALVAAELSALTFATGRRFLIVDGIERWKDAELGEVIGALKTLDPQTTVAFFAREDGRNSVSPKLHKAVKDCGGVVASETKIVPRDLPRWVVAQAKQLQLSCDRQAAQALIDRVGERQQRLQRELEKLALLCGSGHDVSVSDIDAFCAASGETKVWTFADALVQGDRQQAVRTMLELLDQGERGASLMYMVVRRLRQAHEIALRIARGEPRGEIKRSLRMPDAAAERFVTAIAGKEPADFEAAIARWADLEFESRGGRGAPLAEQTRLLQLVLA